MMLLIPDAEIDRWLAEDVPFGDLTTHSLGVGERPGRMAFAARDTMVVAASEAGSYRHLDLYKRQVWSSVRAGAF